MYISAHGEPERAFQPAQMLPLLDMDDALRWFNVDWLIKVTGVTVEFIRNAKYNMQSTDSDCSEYFVFNTRLCFDTLFDTLLFAC